MHSKHTHPSPSMKSELIEKTGACFRSIILNLSKSTKKGPCHYQTPVRHGGDDFLFGKHRRAFRALRFEEYPNHRPVCRTGAIQEV